jgi:hypothetical protein
MDWKELIGKKIVAFRGYNQKNAWGKIELVFILFNDKKSWLELREQDPYDYHDCCSMARTIDLRSDPEEWKKMFEKDGFEEADYSPF